MQRLLLYVHYNNFNFDSGHATLIRKHSSLVIRVVFICSQLPEDVKSNLIARHLKWILERKMSGLISTAWRDGMRRQLATNGSFYSVTLWMILFWTALGSRPHLSSSLYDDEVYFWMTNYREQDF